jgi:hypothetical protein
MAIHLSSCSTGRCVRPESVQAVVIDAAGVGWRNGAGVRAANTAAKRQSTW